MPACERAPEDQLAAAADAVGVVLPDHAAVADFLDDGGVGIALERGHERAERAGVLGLDLGQGEGEAGQVEVADVAGLVIGDEELGDAGVVEDLDPVFAEVALEPGPGDVEAPVQAAGVMDLPGRPLARLEPARLADQELGRHLLRRRIGERLRPEEPLGRSVGGDDASESQEHRSRRARHARVDVEIRWRDIRIGFSCDRVELHGCDGGAGALGSASGAGDDDLARRQVDLRPGIAQVALADPVVQVNDPMDPRIVLDRELAELGIDRELVAEPLVELLDLVALLAGQVLGLLELAVRERRAACAGRPATSTTRPVARSTVEKTVMSSK